MGIIVEYPGKYAAMHTASATDFNDAFRPTGKKIGNELAESAFLLFAIAIAEMADGLSRLIVRGVPHRGTLDRFFAVAKPPAPPMKANP